MKIKMLEGEHLSTAAHSRLHFIGDQENAVLARDLFQPRQKLGRRNDISALALNRLDHNRRHLIRMDRGFEHDILYISRVAEWDVSNAGDEGTKSFPLNRFG